MAGASHHPLRIDYNTLMNACQSKDFIGSDINNFQLLHNSFVLLWYHVSIGVRAQVSQYESTKALSLSVISLWNIQFLKKIVPWSEPLLTFYVFYQNHNLIVIEWQLSDFFTEYLILLGHHR